MRRRALTALLSILRLPLYAESIRGPVAATLQVEPVGPAATASLAVEEIALATPTGDPRFFDALELEFTVPTQVAEFPGAFSLMILTSGTVTQRADIAEINGDALLKQPLVRPGKLIIQIPLRQDSETSANSAVTILDRRVTQNELPLAVTILTSLKGVPPDLAAASFEVKLRPVTRRIGSVEFDFELEDGSAYEVDTLRTPEFSLAIDDERVPVRSEYLLVPGIHRVSLTSERYQDQALSVGVEQGLVTSLRIPLLLALATVNYTAPRGSRVYIDGTALEAESGDFTAVPGEHTIVVVVGDYTVTRRFSVTEGREYNLSVTMGVAIEEAK